MPSKRTNPGEHPLVQLSGVTNRLARPLPKPTKKMPQLKPVLPLLTLTNGSQTPKIHLPSSPLLPTTLLLPLQQPVLKLLQLISSPKTRASLTPIILLKRRRRSSSLEAYRKHASQMRVVSKTRNGPPRYLSAEMTKKTRTFLVAERKLERKKHGRKRTYLMWI